MPLVRKNYQRVISKPPRDNTEVLIETFSFAFCFLFSVDGKVAQEFFYLHIQNWNDTVNRDTFD